LEFDTRFCAAALTPDGSRALVANDDGQLLLLDLETGQTVHTFQGSQSVSPAIAITPDGRRAVLTYFEHLWVLDLQSGQRISEFGGEVGTNTIAVTADGRRAVSGGVSGRLWVWDLERGKILSCLHGHRDSITSVAITPDGLRIVSGSADRTLRVWKLESGQTEGDQPRAALHAVLTKMLRAVVSVASPPISHRTEVRALAVTSDGKWAVSAAGDVQSGQQYDGTVARLGRCQRAVDSNAWST
jgi:WD40 repeat protein